MKIYIVVGFDRNGKDAWDKYEETSKIKAAQWALRDKFSRVVAVFSESEWDAGAKPFSSVARWGGR